MNNIEWIDFEYHFPPSNQCILLYCPNPYLNGHIPYIVSYYSEIIGKRFWNKGIKEENILYWAYINKPVILPIENRFEILDI